MDWFGKMKVPYQGVVIEALNKAMAISLKDEKIPGHPRPIYCKSLQGQEHAVAKQESGR